MPELPLDKSDRVVPAANEAALVGRQALSLDSYRAAATLVAEELGVPLAICKRPTTVAGSGALPYQNKPLREAELDGSEIVEIVRPVEGREAASS